jgi:membrane-bound lytic murein transglycosylase D
MEGHLMKHKILWIGMILFLSSACFPQMGSLRYNSQERALSEEQEKPSLFTPSELETLFSQDRVTDPLELDSALGGSVGGQLFPWDGSRPVSEESNDDFSFEAPSETGPKNGTDFDIPIVMNARVEHFIRYFQTSGKKIFSGWLARSAKYIPMMKTLLKENGLPEDLVYMALIESGFNPCATSRMKAAGPWQFIYRTGKRYGLNVTWWVDERRDPEKSTVAAANYLKDLYDMFECWYLAAAGYNAGEYKIAKAMKRYRTEDFWELTKYRYLKRETKDYVPQMIAAALIAKDPDEYGFIDVNYQEPLCFDKVEVPEVTDLGLIARACEIPLEEVKSLNPELLREWTPPNVSEYEVRIPCGKREVFLRNFEALGPRQRFQFKTHVVKKGDTLAGIAKRYRVNLEPILEINKIKKTTRLPIGTNLLIPIPMRKDAQRTLTSRGG